MAAPLRCRGCAFRGNLIIERYSKVIHASCIMHHVLRGCTCSGAVELGQEVFQIFVPVSGLQHNSHSEARSHSMADSLEDAPPYPGGCEGLLLVCCSFSRNGTYLSYLNVVPSMQI